MNKVNTILSTGIGTNNLMDIWIHQRIEQELHNIFPQYFFYSIPTKDYLRRFRSYTKKSRFVFVAGTNLISSRMHFPYTKQWKLRLRDALFIKELILAGVGWRVYEKHPDIYTRFLLKKLLSERFIHSVRDSYTESKLRAIGINNVINTGCPTMWSLNEEFIADIPTGKAENAVITLCNNKYADERIDKRMIEIVKDNYDEVFFWPQVDVDLDYLEALTSDCNWKERITILSPNLKAYSNLLTSDLSLDSIGSRLHSGIFALRHKRRTIIVGIDNRALEIAKDTGLNVIPQAQLLDCLEQAIYSAAPHVIKIPLENIERWKAQFSIAI